MYRKLVSILTAATFILGSAGSAFAATTLKIGTLAPQDSPWGREFKKWAKDVSDDTGGELTLDFLWNGQAGDEALMVQKIRSGQLDGAAITAIGLSQTGVSDVGLFMLPGLFTSWQKLDAARDAVKDDLNKQFEAKGFTVLGWGDVGALKQMSSGFEIHHPKDLQGKGVFFYSGDQVSPKIYSAIGGITPKQLSIMEVLPALTAGSINVLLAPPLGAEQMQWASRIDHVSTQTLSFAIGAQIMSTPRLNSLPPKLKDVMIKRSAESSERLTKVIRNADAQAFARMKTSKTTYDPTPADVQEWRTIFVKVAKELRGTVFSPAMFDKVVQLAGNPLAQ
ncbi:MAG TPA: TRAP transporter substrate-binding protein DctP [Polyangiaceae bacterium]|nr:TRAP transporter substrate-binding protein DctP [Polyangiaceae bacterium]